MCGMKFFEETRLRFLGVWRNLIELEIIAPGLKLKFNSCIG